MKYPLRARLAAAIDYLDGVLIDNIEALHGIPKHYVCKVVRTLGCPPRRPDLSEIASKGRRRRKTGTEG